MEEKFNIKNKEDITNLEKEFNEGGSLFDKNIKEVVLVFEGEEIKASIGHRTIPEQYYAGCLPYGFYMCQESWNKIKGFA